MDNKKRRAIGIIIAILYLLVSFTHLIGLIIMGLSSETISNLFSSDGETAAIGLMCILIGLGTYIVVFILSLLQGLGAIIGRLPGTIMSGIGILLNTVFLVTNLISLTIFTRAPGLIFLGVMLFLIATIMLCLFSLLNFTYILVEMCVYKGKNK